MPSMVFVRHICDRCAEQQQIEIAPNHETPSMPPGWVIISVGGRTSMLCEKCVDGLLNWLGVRPPALSVVK